MNRLFPTKVGDGGTATFKTRNTLMTTNLICQNHDRYLNDHAFLRLLGEHDICIPSDFLLEEGQAAIDAFWNTYYPEGPPRTVICGLNPGRFGAGQTGIPFMDFLSLSQLLPGIQRLDSERSAGFIFRVVQAYGAEAFFQRFYVTNVASVGFLRDGKNLNYPALPEQALEIVERNFLAEMEIVKPERIISLGREVHRTVLKLLGDRVECESCLPHPAWVATYRSASMGEWVGRYVAEIG
jgi:uracil-DNA glycosylase